MKFDLSSLFKILILLSSLAFLGGCVTESDSDNEVADILPDELILAFIDVIDADYIAYDTTTESTIDLNELAASSGDTAVQKLLLTDTADIGHIYHWPDFRLVDDEEVTDMKYLLMLRKNLILLANATTSFMVLRLITSERRGPHSR